MAPQVEFVFNVFTYVAFDVNPSEYVIVGGVTPLSYLIIILAEAIADVDTFIGTDPEFRNIASLSPSEQVPLHALIRTPVIYGAKLDPHNPFLTTISSSDRLPTLLVYVNLILVYDDEIK
jgi:hypothetical protein